MASQLQLQWYKHYRLKHFCYLTEMFAATIMLPIPSWHWFPNESFVSLVF